VTLLKEKHLFIYHCVDWSAQDGSILINHENKPTTLGQSLDVENYIPWSDQTERITPSSILTNNIVQSISTNSIRHMKDGVINLLIQSPMSYFTREEIPYSARGIKSRY